MKSIFLISVVFFFLSAPLHAQIKNIVFEGAGIRGIAYAGAIQQLEQQGHLTTVDKIGGTSAGAITAMLLCLGYSSAEITNIVHNTPFRKLNQGRFLLAGGLNRIRSYYGWYHGERVEKWLGSLVKAKTGNPNSTFKELHQKGYKALYITGTCLNKQQLVIFSYESYPDMKISDAVRISMSIPLYFEPLFLDGNGKIIKHPKTTKDLDVMVDGGFTANFPIHIFDSTRYINPSLPNQFQVNPFTIGFRIDSEEQINKDHSSTGLASIQIERFSDYMKAFYTLILENLNRQSLSAQDWERTISISDGNIGPRIRRLSKGEVNTLVTNGAVSTTQYIKWKGL